jgi:chromosomal replication initiation ATPase DnaA
MNTADKIIKLSANHFGTTVEMLKMKHGIKGAKRKELALARQCIMVAIRANTNLTIKSIGELFGRDHSTVLNAFRVIKDYQFLNKTFAREFAEYEQMLYAEID